MERILGALVFFTFILVSIANADKRDANVFMGDPSPNRKSIAMVKILVPEKTYSAENTVAKRKHWMKYCCKNEDLLEINSNWPTNVELPKNADYESSVSNVRVIAASINETIHAFTKVYEEKPDIRYSDTEFVRDRSKIKAHARDLLKLINDPKTDEAARFEITQICYDLFQNLCRMKSHSEWSKWSILGPLGRQLGSKLAKPNP